MEIKRPFHQYDLDQARELGSSQTPFSHQNTALVKLKGWLTSAPKSNAGGIVVLPTGGGKTFTAIRFLCSSVIGKDYKVLWLAHTHHLLDQAFLAFARSVGTIPEPKPTLSARIVSGADGHDPIHRVEPTDDVVVATLQTATMAYQKRHHALLAFLQAAGGRLCVVFDEAHHAPAPSYRRFLTALRQEHAEMLLIGLTATPTNVNPRKAGWLKELFPQGIIHQSQAQALIADRILARPNFDRIPTNITPTFDEGEYRKWVATYRDLPEDIIGALAENQNRNALIAEHYLQNREKYGRTIIFAERWYQCEQIESFLEKKGVRAGSVYSRVDATLPTVAGRNAKTASDNHRTLEEFKDGKIDVLINVRMLTEGTDVPQTQSVFLTRQTTSSILLTQMVGRALRGPKAGGTEEAYIVSFEDNWKQRINWADYDQLAEGPTDDFDPEYVRRAPTRMISIDLVRRLADQMDSGVNVAPMEFLRLMPVGWYAVDFQTLVEGTEDIETIRQLVMVFENQEEGYRQFLDHLSGIDLGPLVSEHASMADVGAMLDDSIGKFFPVHRDEITRIVPKDLFHLARHVAQADGEPPRFFPFEGRTGYDLDAVAQGHIDRDLGPTAINQDLKTEFERRDRFWASLYPNYHLFKTQYDACANRILDGPPPEEDILKPKEPVEGREPPEELKRQVKSRDGWRFLCCGEPNRRRLQIDHIEPSYFGGANSLENLQTLCKDCNHEKGTKKIDFRIHRDGSLVDAPVGFPEIYHPSEGDARDRDVWVQCLRMVVNFFYRAAAVEKVIIGAQGTNFYEWTFQLYEGNEPSWLRNHLPRLLAKIREVRSAAQIKGPDGLRVPSPGRPEAAYFVEDESISGPSEFAGIPNGSQCRLTFEGRTHLGTLRNGMLRIDHRGAFDSFKTAYQEITGRNTNDYWRAWEIRRPDSPDWIRGNDYRTWIVDP